MSSQNTRAGSRRARAAAHGVLALVAAGAVACVTPAEFRKVSNRLTDLERARGAGGDPDRTRVADLVAEIDALEQQVAMLQGRIEVAEHRVETALEEARAARSEANQRAPGAAPDGGEAGSADGDDVSEEVARYREAYAHWRTGSPESLVACVDQFTQFLQAYPASEYADDATYWLADCYFKQGDFRSAVLRFDDVARNYPGGNKAADALYRQGEALLRMGHGQAAGNAFEKVLRDYPDSARASEAKKQLDLLGAG